MANSSELDDHTPPPEEQLFFEHCSLLCKKYYGEDCPCESITTTTCSNPLSVQVLQNHSTGRNNLHVFPDVVNQPETVFRLGSEKMSLIDTTVQIQFPSASEEALVSLKYNDWIPSLYACQNPDMYFCETVQEMVNEGYGYSDAWMITSTYLKVPGFTCAFGIVHDVLMTCFTIPEEISFTVEDPHDILLSDGDAFQLTDIGENLIILHGVYLQTTEFDDYCLKFSFENGVVLFFKKLYTAQDVEDDLQIEDSQHRSQMRSTRRIQRLKKGQDVKTRPQGHRSV